MIILGEFAHKDYIQYTRGGQMIASVPSLIDLDVGYVFHPNVRSHLHVRSLVHKAGCIRIFIIICVWIWWPLHNAKANHCDGYANYVISKLWMLINIIGSVQEQFLMFALGGLEWNPSWVLPPYVNQAETWAWRRLSIVINYLMV